MDLSQYGPYAFGPLVVIVLWQVILAPELRAQRKAAEVWAQGAASISEGLGRLERMLGTERDRERSRDAAAEGVR